MSKERRLGRGLEALLGRSFDSSPADETPQTQYDNSTFASGPEGFGGGQNGDLTVSPDGQQWLEVAAIDRNPYQPRQAFDDADLADLCDSIRTHGFLQPIVVRRMDGRYQLIAGERRLRAAQMAAWDRVPVLVREVNDREMAELAIVENLQRKDLNPIEKATSFHRYMYEYNCTQEELSARLSVDRSTVSNLIRLLDLPDEVKHMVSRGELSASHARALLPVGEERQQVDFAWKAVKESLSVRALEQAVSDLIAHEDGGAEPLSIVDREGNSRPSPLQPGQHLRQMEEELKLQLGVKVEIKQTSRGRGRFTIHFTGHDEFERLRQALIQGSRRASIEEWKPADEGDGPEFPPQDDFGTSMASG